ncbi:MAG: dUTP diphosphatase [Candidatus Omnitrophica bacterium]|nr:dUTP diphosphatase [Candidatus Omnitrophota bacterium]
MHQISLQIQVLREEARSFLPQYMSAGASGMDVCACIEEPVIIAPFERTIIPTGIAIGVPAGYEAQIRPRSGLAAKHGLTLLNTPGTIDSDYRGELKIIVINLGGEPFEITHGMRIAQMVITACVKADIIVTTQLDETVRGSGGFGHTGVSNHRIV